LQYENPRILENPGHPLFACLPHGQFQEKVARIHVFVLVESGKKAQKDDGCPRSPLREVFDQVEQGLVTFSKVADFRGPVVHFDVDVGGVLAAPGRHDRLIPDALEVGWLAAGAAAGNQNIPAKLKAERFQT
jgi:hypothetical protein